MISDNTTSKIGNKTMTEPEHSPGPWRIEVESCGTTTICTDDDLIAELPRSDPDNVNAANARLFAAAPEMLAALIDAENAMFRALEDHKFDSPADSAAVIDTLVIVRAAIAKATKGE